MDQYNLPIGGDIGPLLNDLKAAKTGLQDLNDSAKSTSQTIKEGFAASSQAVENSNKVLAQSVTAYNTAKQSIAQLTDALKFYQDSAFGETDIGKLKAYNANIKLIEDEIQKLGTIGTKSYAEQRGQIERLNTALKLYKDFLTQATNTDQIVKYNQKIVATQDAITKLGNVGKAGFDTLGNKIIQTQGIQEQLTTKVKDFQAQIAKATDPAAIASLNKQLEQTQAELAKVNNAGKTGFDNLGNAIGSSSSATSTLIGGLKSLAGAFGLVIGIQVLVSLGKELFNTAVEVSGIDRAFTNLARPDLLPKLRAETKGFVDDLDLERLTVKANNFNIPLEKLGTLLLFASQRAKDTGVSVDTLTNNIIDGLGKKSTKVIDNLGISAIEVQKEFRKTGDFTTAVVNIVQRDMVSAGVAVDTLADKVNRQNTFWSNLKTNVSRFFAEQFIEGAPNDEIIGQLAAKQIKRLGDFAKQSEDQRKAIIAKQIEDVKKLSDAYKKAQSFTVGNSPFDGSSNTFDQIQNAKKAAGEQLAANQAVLKVLQKQSAELTTQYRLQKGLTSDAEKEAQIKNLRQKVSDFVVGVSGTQTDKTALIKQADDLQKIVDESNAKAEGKRQKAEDTAARKALERAKKVGDEQLQLQNQITADLAQGSEIRTEKEVEQENARFINALRILGKEQKDFPELQALINQAIEAENTAHSGRLALILKKQSDEQAKILSEGQKAIASVLKESEDEQLKQIDQKYVDIREKAKKAGLLTAQVEAQLATQQEKDKTALSTKLTQDRNDKIEAIAIAGVQSRQKAAGDTDKKFELENQQAILEIKIEFAQKALQLIENDPEKVVQAANLKATIAELKKQLKGVGEALNTENGFSFSHFIQKAFGLDDAGFKDLEKAGQAVVDLFNQVADGIVASYQREIDAGQERIDALSDQLNQAQSYLDEQNSLKAKGYANDSKAAQKNVNAIKAALASEEAARQQNIKNQQDAQKISAEIRAAEIAANTIETVSSLVTAAAKIFKAHAGITFVGVIIAIAAIAAMVAGFLAVKASIQSAATDTSKKEKGGYVGGKSHKDGGNKYISMDGNDRHIVEIEKDEYVINKKSTAKHEKLIEAINRDDFSGLNMNDYSLQELLKGTGVANHSDIAKQIGKDTADKQDKLNVIVLPQSQDPHLPLIASHLQKLVEYEESKPNVIDMGDYVEIRSKKGNHIERRKK